MAPRVNVEDDVESRPEFRQLLKLVGGDDDRALGMLVRFWRLAQKHWVEGKLVPLEDIDRWGLQPIVESHWGIRRKRGVYAIGAEERFAWLVQRTEAGKKRASGARTANGRFTSGQPADTSAAGVPIQPLTPTLPLAPTLPQEKRERKEPTSLAGQAECLEAWGRTLARYQIPKDPKLDELNIARLIQSHGAEKTRLALLGAGFEEKSADYDPAKHVSIRRLDKAAIFEKFVNLGARAPKPRPKPQPRPEPGLEHFTPMPPELKEKLGRLGIPDENRDRTKPYSEGQELSHEPDESRP